MKKLLASVFGIITLFNVGYGQDKEENPDNTGILDEILIQGSRIEIPFSESTRDVQIVTAEEISNLPVQSINELLAYVGGVDIRQRGPFGGQADISLDGGTFEQTLVLINGVKLIDDQTAHLMMNIPIPLQAIDHIEVLRGTAARVYGINALTGAINIVTKNSAQSFLLADFNLASGFKKREEDDKNGVYGGGSIELVGNYAFKKQRHLLAFSQDLYNGQRYNTALNNTRLFYNGKYKFDAKNSIQAMAGYTHNRYGANGFYAAPGDKEAEEISETSIFSLSSTHRLGNFTIKPRISDRYDTDDYRYFKHDLNTARSQHYTNAFSAELNVGLQTDFGDFGLGWETRLSHISSSNMGKHSRDNHGAYVEYRRKFGDKWITTLGAYLNYNTDYDWQTYPGMDIAYTPTTHWKISANVGSAQRLPSFTDLYIDQAPGNVGNPNVRPEKAWQYEGAVAYDKNNFSIKTGYFYRDISDFIDWVRANDSVPYSSDNLGQNKTHGIYTRIRQEFKFGGNQSFGYNLSYNYLNPTINSDSSQESKYILESLKHQFIAGINYLRGNFSVQIQNRWVKRELNSGYDLLDIRAQYQLKSFRLYTDVSNVFNTAYKEAGAVPMPPRWFSIGVKYKLTE